MDSNNRETCTLCLEDFTEPKVLPCGHKFCKKCLENLLMSGGPLSCPNCREKYTVPDCGVDAFPTDFAAQTSAEHEFPSLEEEAACKGCDDECVLTAYCVECEGGICEECVEAHGRLKPLKSHNVVASKDLSLDSFKPPPKPQQCSKHGKALELFCEQCGWPLCLKCLVSTACSHHRHMAQVKTIEEVREKREREVRELKERAEKMLLSSKERVQYLTEVRETMATYPKEVEQIINDIFDEYESTLQTWRRQQLQEASERSSEMIKQVSSETTDERNQIDKLQSGIGFAVKALSCTTNVYAVTMSGLAIKQLDVKSLECQQKLCRPLVFSKGSLHLGGLREIEAGEINVTIPEVCIMDQDIDINVSFGVVFHTKPLIKVLYGSAKQRSITLQPESIESNACTVSYRPRCAGKHSIEVHINGVKCAENYDIMDVEGAPEVGALVKPGPDWKGEEEGEVAEEEGEVAEEESEVGESGIVLNVEMGQGQKYEAVCYYVLTVQWENEQVKKYDWGRNNLYELELDI